jgi:hypothetical protein
MFISSRSTTFGGNGGNGGADALDALVRVFYYDDSYLSCARVFYG